MLQQDFKTPEDQKYAYDNASLQTVMKPFLSTLESRSNFIFKTFLSDSEFDSYENFDLLKNLNFEKVFIPLNYRNKKNSTAKDLEFNTERIHLCPIIEEPLKIEGPSGGKKRSEHFKFTWPKSFSNQKGKCYYICANPCTTKKISVKTYVYPDKDFRVYPGI